MSQRESLDVTVLTQNTVKTRFYDHSYHNAPMVISPVSKGGVRGYPSRLLNSGSIHVYFLNKLMFPIFMEGTVM